MNNDNAIRMKLAAACLAAASMLSLPAFAQVQRTFVNLGFEQPALTGSSCYLIFSATATGGWVTNHSNNVVSGSCTLAGFPNGAAITQPIEIWRGPSMGGLPPRSGNQHAELNAYEASRLSQTICLTPGEQIDWNLSHRGRNVLADQMNFNIGSTANTVAVLTSDTVGGGGAPSCPDSGGVDNVSCTSVAAANGWRDYSGRFIWNGTGGNHTFGFQAVGGGGSGNFLDEIQVTLRPYVEFSATGFGTREGQAASLPQIRVSGRVPVGGITVNALITVGTAVSPSDYTTSSGNTTVSIPVPEGFYNNNLFSVPATAIAIVDDTVVENNETITLQLQPSVANYTLSSTSTCGGAPTTTTTLTLLDNDVDVRTTKTVNSATPTAGGTAIFTVTYQNNTARPTVGTGTDLTMHDAAVTLADALPVGFTAFSWTCAASGTPAPACPAANGTGAINAAASLPAGNAAAAGGTLTYTITGTLAATQCSSTTNTSTITANSPVAEATTSQSGFDTPVPGGTANNTATAAVDPLCADLSINKTNTPGVGPADQPADTVVSGVASTYSLRIVNAGPDAVANALVRDTPGTGITCPGTLGSTTVACSTTSSPAGATTCPATGVLTTANLFGAGIAIPSLGVSPTPATPNNFVTLTFTCTVN